MPPQRRVVAQRPRGCTDTPPQAALPEARWNLLISIGAYHARNQSLPHDEVEDCARESAWRLVAQAERHPIPQEETFFLNWSHRCCRNHVRNYQDKLYRLQKRVVPLAYLEQLIENEVEAPSAGGADGLPPELSSNEVVGAALRKEFWKTVAESLAALEPLQRVVFTRASIEEESVETIALALGRTPNAVRLLQLRARRRLRASLARRGITETELRSYIVGR